LPPLPAAAGVDEQIQRAGDDLGCLPPGFPPPYLISRGNFDSIGKRRPHCVMGSFGLGDRAKANREQRRAVLVRYAEAVEIWAVERLNRSDPEVLKHWHLVTSAACCSF
jgi:hypothetical protein